MEMRTAEPHSSQMQALTRNSNFGKMGGSDSSRSFRFFIAERACFGRKPSIPWCVQACCKIGCCNCRQTVIGIMAFDLVLGSGACIWRNATKVLPAYIRGWLDLEAGWKCQHTHTRVCARTWVHSVSTRVCIVHHQAHKPERSVRGFPGVEDMQQTFGGVSNCCSPFLRVFSTSDPRLGAKKHVLRMGPPGIILFFR